MLMWQKKIYVCLSIATTVFFLASCSDETYITTEVFQVDFSSTQIWVLRTVSTNNNDVSLVILEEKSDGGMFMTIKRDFDGGIFYNSPTVVNEKLENKGFYVVKNKKLIRLNK